MAEVFADTSGWATFFVHTEPFHALADSLMRQWQADGTRAVTTNYVLTELVALLTSPFRTLRAQQVTTIETVKAASWVEVVHIDPSLEAQAWALLKARLDKEWSLVDCASFAVMHHRSIIEALTTDHHFKQAGLVRLPRITPTFGSSKHRSDRMGKRSKFANWRSLTGTGRRGRIKLEQGNELWEEKGEMDDDRSAASRIPRAECRAVRNFCIRPNAY